MINRFLLGSFLGNIKMANQHKKESIIVPKSKYIKIFLKIFLKEHFIKAFLNCNNASSYILFLKYARDNTPLIKDIKVISRPGKKIYVNLYNLKSLLYKNKSIFYILSTHKGILSGSDAIKLKIGGEILFKIAF